MNFPRSVVLIGPMGSGKTALAPLLGDALGLDFKDTDEIVEKEAGMTVSEIFSELGESRFRHLESCALEKALKSGISVISTGGGALCNLSAWKSVRSYGALSVYLKSSPALLASRVSFNRPLLQGASSESEKEEIIRNIIRDRAGWYERSDIHIDSSGSLKEVAQSLTDRIISSFNQSIPIRLGENSYTAWILEDICSLGDKLARRLPPEDTLKSCSIIADRNVSELYAKEAKKSLEAAGYRLRIFDFEPGEKSKNLSMVGFLADKLISSGHRRGEPLIAMGGGVTGDIGGLIASMLYRGCPLVHVPTTLLSMADSGIGGKNGVNLSGIKNVMGTFYQPVLVFAPINTLKSLEDRHYRSGLGEILKTALLEPGFSLLHFIEQNISGINMRDPEIIREMLMKSIAFKANIVEQDPLEQRGRRIILNLGHSLGHALESAGGYERWLHGEAVGLGILGSLRISSSLALIHADTEKRIASLLDAMHLPCRAEDIWNPAIIEMAGKDKKFSGDKVNFVVPVDGGGAELVGLTPFELESILCRK